MFNHEKEKYSIKAVENALLFLNALGQESGEFGISHLSEKLGLQKSSIFRLMVTFEKMGYVEQVKETRNYKLGLSAYETGQKLVSRMKLLNRAKPVMESLVRECDETIYLVLPAGREILLMDKVDTTNPVSIVSLVGKRYPLMQSAAGKVIQAYSTEPTNSISTEKATLSQDALKVIRQIGACEDVGGLGDGIACLAVPLLDAQKRVLGCLCFVGPQFRFTREKVQSELLPRLKAAGRSVSSQFGYLDDLMNWGKPSIKSYPLPYAFSHR